MLLYSWSGPLVKGLGWESCPVIVSALGQCVLLWRIQIVHCVQAWTCNNERSGFPPSISRPYESCIPFFPDRINSLFWSLSGTLSVQECLFYFDEIPLVCLCSQLLAALMLVSNSSVMDVTFAIKTLKYKVYISTC